MLRRLFWLALIGGAGYAGWTAWQRHNAPTPAGPPEWPLLDSTSPPKAAPVAFAETPDTDADESTASGSDGVPWVEPLDGGCPDGYPIKANNNSGIFHMPGGRFYDRTAAERCYARPEDAEADGYRAAKS